MDQQSGGLSCRDVGDEICKRGGYMNLHRFKGRLGGVAIATVFGLVVATGFGVTRLRGDIQGANEPPSLKLSNPDEGPSRNSFAPIVKKVLPEVVNVSSTKVVKASAEQ